MFFILLLNVGLVAGQCELNDLDICIESQHPNTTFCNYYIQCTLNAELTCNAINLMCTHGYVFDTNICSIPELAATCPVPKTSIQFMALSTRNVGAQDPLKFDQIILNEGLSWDTDQDRFYARYSWGTYFVAVSAGIRSGFPVYNELSWNKDSANDFTAFAALTRNSTAHNSVDTVSRNLIVDLVAGHQFKMTSSSDLEGDARLLSSLSVFSISAISGNIFDSDEFCFSRKTGSFPGAIVFDEQLAYSDGGGYDSTSGRFTAEDAGNYVFCYSVGVEAGKQANVTLVKTPEFGTGEHVAGLVRMSTIHNNVDTLSRCILMPLEAADQVHIQNVHDVITSTEKGRETSFMGFQYKPGLTRPAWSVARTSSYSASGDTILSYDTVLVNINNAWRPSNNNVVLNSAGKYFIHLSAGAQSGQRVALRLRVQQTSEVMELYRQASNHNGIDTLSRSGIFDFSRNDILDVINWNGRSVYSNELLQTAFVGFYIGA